MDKNYEQGGTDSPTKDPHPNANDGNSTVVSTSGSIQQNVNPTNPKTKTNQPQQSKRPIEWLSKTWAFIKEPQHANAVVAIFTLLLFFTTTIYTVFAALQWITMRNTLIVNTKTLSATQAAAFDCQSRLDQGADLRLIIECRNQGQMSARDLKASMTFVRWQDGREAQKAGWPINHPFIVKGEPFTFIVLIPLPVGVQPSEWIARQRMEAKISFSFNNGVESVSDRNCWALLTGRSWSMTDCDNARSINGAQQ